MELIPDIKSYDWGKLGTDSEVANLAVANSGQSLTIQPAQSYAEWWIGDHVSGPSVLKATAETLSAAIGRNPAWIGHSADATGPAVRLPFLLKVLSIRKALSIQVHPSKEEAERLHRDRPDLYKDPNHKPELAIALTPFLALCGFRPHAELYAELQRLAPLRELLGTENLELLKSAGAEGLKKCFAQLMHSQEEQVNTCIRQLTEIFRAKDFAATIESDIFLRLQTDFPNDVGSLSLFFLNVLQLQPGEAIFLAAREPHAYLAGNCVECMACSDNVIRAGLTPKFKDVDELLHQLNYEGGSGASKIFRPRRLDANTEVFVPAVRDFAVAKITLPAAKVPEAYEWDNRAGGSVLLVLGGEATLLAEGREPVAVQRGSVVFVPSTSARLTLLPTVAEEFVAYQAMYNDFDA